MVIIETNFNELESTQYYYGECDSLLANCCSKTRLPSSFKFRPMNKRRRQKAFEMLRQMKLHHQDIENLSTRSKRRKHKKRFYKTFCCTGKIIS